MALMPASGGTEKPFIDRRGRKVMYVYDPATGDHGYLDMESDVLLPPDYDPSKTSWREDMVDSDPSVVPMSDGGWKTYHVKIDGRYVETISTRWSFERFVDSLRRKYPQARDIDARPAKQGVDNRQPIG